jgi:hypothetical protein
MGFPVRVVRSCVMILFSLILFDLDIGMLTGWMKYIYREEQDLKGAEVD